MLSNDELPPVISAIKARALPKSFDDLASTFLSVDGLSFAAQEDTYFDYKEAFPFSTSDEYFFGIVRLVCAFHNTYGGLLLFGVHDRDRTAGHNKVRVNIERFNTRLREVLVAPVECRHRAYDMSAGAIDVILVPKRPVGTPLSKLASPEGTQKPRVWIRSGHEVLELKSSDIPFAFGPREDYGLQELAAAPRSPKASLPPTPATIKEFVGRIDVLDRLFTWFNVDDDPRCFLYGRGGSGKSTIAFEFAKLVAAGAGYALFSNDNGLDRVVFLSAKENYFNPYAGRTENFRGTDFSTAEEMYRAILTLSDWAERDIGSLDESALREAISDLFRREQLLLVLDDIDTLILKKLDPGMDFLYRVVARSPTRSKILYTQRSVPTQSIQSAIEVPGLQRPGEYEEFVTQCVHQFKVPKPPQTFIAEALWKASEGKPLAIETIVAYRRTLPTYEKALEAWSSHEGSAARRYLFQREYEALPADNRARHMMAALALLDRAATFQDLQSILLFEDDQLRDAISQTFELFLSTAEDREGASTYFLGGATKEFILAESQKLNRFDNIRVRLEQYEAKVAIKGKEVAELEVRVERHMNGHRIDLAWRALCDRQLPPAVTENATILALKGRVALQLTPAQTSEALSCFAKAFSLGFRDIRMFEAWVFTEKMLGRSAKEGVRICDQYLSDDAIAAWHPRIWQRRGILLYQSAREDGDTSPAAALERHKAALHSHIRAHSLMRHDDESYKHKYTEYLRNTAFYFVTHCSKMQRLEVAIDALIREIEGVKKELDPIKEPLKWLMELAGRAGSETVNRVRPALHRFKQKLADDRYLNLSNKADRVEIAHAVSDAIKALGH